MNTDKKTVKMEDMKVKLSTLWIVVMFNMAFADILSFMMEYSTGHTPEFQATQGLMLIAAIILEIPIVMIFLSRVLKYGANRWANIIAGVITILFVIGGGSTYLHYIFFATIEVVCTLLIVWYAWKWSE
ncbi:MAG: hypothetical protein GY832_29865 [Chloroflexi bacterium]|nr:hypothetical protein [Chloroflexota bacterium]